MSKVVILNHPLIDHKMMEIRDKRTGTKEFRESVSEVGALITYEITRDFTTVPKTIETPICETPVYELEKQGKRKYFKPKNSNKNRRYITENHLTHRWAPSLHSGRSIRCL